MASSNNGDQKDAFDRLFESRQEQVQAVPRVRPKFRQGRFTYVQLPVKYLEKLPIPEILILVRLCKLHFRNRGQNPIRLSTSFLQKEYGLSRGQKSRALKSLSKSGMIEVVFTHGKNPMVKLQWLPLKEIDLGE
jgi:hypothetical protein